MIHLSALLVLSRVSLSRTSDAEKISFNQINRKTGHRIKYTKVDADIGDEVSNEDIIKGYKVVEIRGPLRNRCRICCRKNRPANPSKRSPHAPVATSSTSWTVDKHRSWTPDCVRPTL